MSASKKLFHTGIVLAIIMMAIGVAGSGSITMAAAGDPVADRVLGQPGCFNSSCNTVDPEAMNNPNAVAVDKSVTPNRVYVADTSNNRVLGYSSITALVNGGPATLVIGQPDFFSSNAGFSTSAATLNGPKAVAVDTKGNLFVADTNASRVLEYNTPFSSGKTAGIAANMVFGQGLDFTSNQCNFSFGTPPSQESMCNPAGVAVDSAGNLFVSDTGNNRVLGFKFPYNAATDADVVFGQAGSFSAGKCNQSAISTSSTAGTLCNPNLLAVDASNNLYVADTGNNRVLKFNTPLTNQTANAVFGQNASFTTNSCNQSVSASNSTLCQPLGVSIDSVGDVFIGDTNNNRVLMYKPPIAPSPLANFVLGQSGSFSSTNCNGGFGTPPSNATLCGPRGVATDSSNAASTTANLMIADSGNNRVLKWPYTNGTGPAAGATVVLGQVDFAHNSSNTVDATALCSPAAVAIDKSATPNHLWVVDTNNNRVLGYNSAATFATYAPANIVIGQADFSSGTCNQGSFSGPTAKTLCTPNAAVVDTVGNLWVSDGGNNRVLMFPRPFSSGLSANEAATVVLGQGGNFTTSTGVCPPNNSCPSMPPPAAGTANQGGMCLPSGVALGVGGTPLYVSDENNNRVLVFKTLTNGALPALVLGQANFTGNYCNRNNSCGFIFPSASTMCGPDQIATDALGNLYVGDTDNSRTLEFNVPNSTGVAANRVFGQLGNFTGSDCNLDSEMRTLNADSLCDAEGVAADTSSTPNIYVADTGNNRVLWYKTPLTLGTTADLAFGQPDFSTNLCNFGGSAPSCKSLCGPLTPAVDSLGNLYVPDAGNNRVLEYDNPVPTPTPTPTSTPSAAPTKTPTAVPTLAPVGPVISYLSMPPGGSKTSYVMVGTGFIINGSGFTPGSVVNFFVATSRGAVNAGPLVPSGKSATQLNVMVPSSISLGQGVASVQVVNTDRGYAGSNAVNALLFGSAGVPTIKSINSVGLAASSLDPAYATDNVQTVVQQGTVVTLGGSGFDTVNGVAIDLFCACAGGKVGPFFVAPGASLTATTVSFFLPAAGAPNSPSTGPGSFVVSNAGADGSYSKKSNAVSAPIGALISVTGVSQDKSTITVSGTGFSTLTMINLFNPQSGGVVNLGGLKPDGTPAIPATFVSDTELTFTVPAGAVPGSSYVQAINPPFLPYTSSGSDPGGAFTLK